VNSPLSFKEEMLCDPILGQLIRGTLPLSQISLAESFE